jgi:molybdopterin converting factor subunit 1
MNVRIQLFAIARQLAGQEVVELSLPEGATVNQLRRALQAQVPALAAVLPHVVFAVDAEYADDQAVIPAGASIACIPPVSGG